MTTPADTQPDPTVEPAVEWTVNPWKADPRRATLAVLFFVLFGAVMLTLDIAKLTAVVLWLAFMVSLSPALWVLRCRVDDSGVARRLLFVWDRRPWERIGQAKLTEIGLWIAPPATPRWLEPFRGLWLPLRGVSRDEDTQLRSELRHRLVQHGF